MATCAYCGTLATDPGRGPSTWAKAVVDDEQVLVCPDCQRERPDWAAEAEPCPSCGSKRLRKVLGDKICRACNHQWSEDTFTLE